MIPVVTIVGRPNVGKSTLFNRLVGRRQALVDDFPGVTRDRHYGEARHLGRHFTVIDTGGYDPEAEGNMLALMREQAQVGMEEADVVLFLLDGKEGLTHTDELIAEQLRRSTKPVFSVVNKLETKNRESDAYDFYRLGIEELHFISAEHGNGFLDLMEHVVNALPEADFDDELVGDKVRETSIAVIGRPNVGKSTIINHLLGEERLLASDMPGTTRDAIDSILERDGKRYRLIDTAGVRRKRAIRMRLEAYSVIKAFKAIDRAHVALLLFDATEPFVEQEARLAGMIHDKGRACVLVVNKWDLVEKDTNTAGEFVKRLRDHLKFMPYAPVIFVSAKSGQRVGKLLDFVDRVRENHQRRIQTSVLNRFSETTLEAHHLPVHKGRRVKIYYLAQVAVRPPTFVGVANYPDAIHFSYQRYLLNALRDNFDFEGTPVRIKFKGRTRKSKSREPETPEE